MKRALPKEKRNSPGVLCTSLCKKLCAVRESEVKWIITAANSRTIASNPAPRLFPLRINMRIMVNAFELLSTTINPKSKIFWSGNATVSILQSVVLLSFAISPFFKKYLLHGNDFLSTLQAQKVPFIPYQSRICNEAFVHGFDDWSIKTKRQTIFASII